MPPVIIAVAAAAAIAGGVAAKNAGSGDAGDAHNAANIAYQKLQDLGLPPDQSKAIIYEQFKQKGLMTPELEQHINQQASKMADIKEDPSLKSAQMDALQTLQQRGKTGLTPEDRAAMNQLRQQVATDTEAKRQQILQNFAARGQAGGGAELAAALQSSQSGANQESQAGDRLAAMASQNALQAIGQAGTLGGQIRGQEFGQKAQQANAQDVINQFNTANQVQQQARNVGAENQGQMYNLQNAQNISNANTQQANQELLRQQQAQEQYYQDLTKRAQIQSGAATQYGNERQASSAREASSAGAPYSAVSAGLMSYGTNALGGGAKKAYNGGEIHKYADGGEVPSDQELTQESMVPAHSMLNQRAQQNREIISRWKMKHNASDEEANNMLQELQDKDTNFWSGQPANNMADGGSVPSSDNSLAAILSKVLGQRDSNPAPVPNQPATQNAQDSMRKAFGYANGGPISPDIHQRRLPTTDYRNGGHVSGPEIVPGNSPKNDVVPAMLSGGEYVVDKENAKSPFGNKLIKLLKAHHEVMQHAKDKGE